MENPTLQAMSEIDPRIGDLVNEARTYTSDKPFCALDVFEGYRERIRSLVGWYGHNEQLGDSDCYLLLLQTVEMVIPDCTANCGCAPVHCREVLA